MNLNEIIKQPEGRRLEFKENLSDGNKIEKTVIAFSNDAGGEIYLGIKNDPRKIIGFPEDEILKLEEQVSSNLIEQWGTGFKKLNDELVDYPEIEVKYLEPGLSFQIQFIKKNFISQKSGLGTYLGRSRDQVGSKLALSRQQVEDLLKLCRTAKPITELMKLFNLKNRTKFKNKFINPLIEINLIAMTIPAKPNSSKQKYIITENGRELLDSIIDKEETQTTKN